MKSLLPLVALLILMAGCASPSGAPGDGKAVAKLQEHIPSTDASPANKEIRCHIQMIDGVETGSSESLKPGHHRVIVALGNEGSEHVGDVNLLIPAAKSYRLKAERNAEVFLLTLIDEETGAAAATSTALASQVMKFEVFVIQK